MQKETTNTQCCIRGFVYADVILNNKLSEYASLRSFKSSFEIDIDVFLNVHGTRGTIVIFDTSCILVTIVAPSLYNTVMREKTH